MDLSGSRFCPIAGFTISVFEISVCVRRELRWFVS